MSHQPKVYTFGHILGMTVMVAAATTYMYSTRHEHADLVWFMENWGLHIGIALTVLTFLFGLSILGTPWYDEKTNQQLAADQNQADFEWNQKSPEERAIISTARNNELLQLIQIMQNNRIIEAQEQLKRSKRS
jgi:hypothetical protein